MAVDTLLTKAPNWFALESSGATGVLFAQATLSRNLSDFPFPSRCSEDEKQAVLDRVLAVLDSLNLFSAGQFYLLAELDPVEIRFLAERRLITTEMIMATGPRGVYVAEDQSLSIMVNGDDHLAMRCIKGGGKLKEAWTRLNNLDDNLASGLDFAYHEDRGYLTASLDQVGTGLKAGIVLHLPAMAIERELNAAVDRCAGERLTLGGMIAGIGVTTPALAPGEAEGVERIREQSLLTNTAGGLCASTGAALGDLFLLVNRGGLGQSEEELVFQVCHHAAALEEQETQLRERLVGENARAVEDRAGRARGIAGGARLLSFAEGLALLSAIRHGQAAGMLPRVSARDLNELTLSSQGAHLEMACGEGCDALSLNQQRADLFRDRFASE